MSAALHLYTQGKTTTAYTTSQLPKQASIGNSMQFTSAIYEPTSSSYTSNPSSGILRNTFNYLTNQNINFNIVGVSRKGAANVIEFDADTDSNPILSGPIDDGYGVILNAEFIPAVRDTSSSAPAVISPYSPPVPVVTALPITSVSYIKPGQVINAPSINDTQVQSSTKTIIPNTSTNNLSQTNIKMYILIFILIIIVGVLYYKLRQGLVSQRSIMGGTASKVLYGGAQFIATTILGGIGYAIGGTVGSMGISRMTGGNNINNNNNNNNNNNSNNHQETGGQNLPEVIKGGKTMQQARESKIRLRY